MTREDQIIAVVAVLFTAAVVLGLGISIWSAGRTGQQQTRAKKLLDRNDDQQMRADNLARQADDLQRREAELLARWEAVVTRLEGVAARWEQREGN